MSTYSAIYVRKKAADEVTRDAILRLYPEADVETFRRFIGIEFELTDDDSKRSERELRQLSVELGTDVLWVVYQTTAGSFRYHHWQNGAQVRALVYGWEKEGKWERAEGPAEPWERKCFWGQAAFEMNLAEARNAAERKKVRKMWAARELIEGSDLPVAGADDAVEAILEHYRCREPIETDAEKRAKKLFKRGEFSKFIQACREGDLAFVKQMIKRGMDPNILPEHLDTRPLPAAADGGDLKTVKFLLKAGANPNLANKGLGWPPNAYPLEAACAKGHLKIAEVLVAHGANINRVGCFSPLKAAVAHRQPEVVHYLLKLGARLEPDITHWSRTPGVLQELIGAGADIHYRSQDGGTPLHSAAGRDDPEFTRILISAGADVNARTSKTEREWKTPLHEAGEAGNEETIRMLIEAGSNPKAKDRWGRTYEHYLKIRRSINRAIEREKRTEEQAQASALEKKKEETRKKGLAAKAKRNDATRRK